MRDCKEWTRTKCQSGLLIWGEKNQLLLWTWYADVQYHKLTVTKPLTIIIWNVDNPLYCERFFTSLVKSIGTTSNKAILKCCSASVSFTANRIQVRPSLNWDQAQYCVVLWPQQVYWKYGVLQATIATHFIERDDKALQHLYWRFTEHLKIHCFTGSKQFLCQRSSGASCCSRHYVWPVSYFLHILQCKTKAHMENHQNEMQYGMARPLNYICAVVQGQMKWTSSNLASSTPAAYQQVLARWQYKYSHFQTKVWVCIMHINVLMACVFIRGKLGNLWMIIAGFRSMRSFILCPIQCCLVYRCLDWRGNNAGLGTKENSSGSVAPISRANWPYLPFLRGVNLLALASTRGGASKFARLLRELIRRYFIAGDWWGGTLDAPRFDGTGRRRRTHGYRVSACRYSARNFYMFRAASKIAIESFARFNIKHSGDINNIPR